MASAPKPQLIEVEAPTLHPGRTQPGYGVDEFIAKGKIDEARGELERLLQEGIDSGEGVPMNEGTMQHILAEARARVGRTAG